MRQAEVDGGQRPGTSTADARRIAELERENRELRRANEILRAASASRGSWTRDCPSSQVHRRTSGSLRRCRTDLPGPARRRCADRAVDVLRAQEPPALGAGGAGRGADPADHQDLQRKLPGLRCPPVPPRAAAVFPPWINARTDSFLAGVGPAGRRLDDALQRAERYAAAVADSLFVPGLVDPAALAELAAGPLPVAAVVWPGAPPVADLAAAGVVRISLGSATAQAACATAARAATELLTTGTHEATANAIPYDTMNTMFLGAGDARAEADRGQMEPPSEG